MEEPASSTIQVKIQSLERKKLKKKKSFLLHSFFFFFFQIKLGNIFGIITICHLMGYYTSSLAQYQHVYKLLGGILTFEIKRSKLKIRSEK